MKLKFKKKDASAITPQYMTEDAAGLDLFANLETALVLKPLQRALIPTGIFLEIPKGYEAQIRPRSGLAIKHGITLLNSPGTIDADYRGEIKVIMINLSEQDFEIKQGLRIAQMVFNKIVKAKLVSKKSLKQTKRDKGGFGHTGQ